MFQIEVRVKETSRQAGEFYIMHGEKDEIIYVGKAISLKNRVRTRYLPE